MSLFGSFLFGCSAKTHKKGCVLKQNRLGVDGTHSSFVVILNDHSTVTVLLFENKQF